MDELDQLPPVSGRGSPDLPLPAHVRPSLEWRSSASSGRKRKQFSSTGSGITVTSVSDAFSVRTKQIVVEMMGERCWHCGATPVDCCHIINKRNAGFSKVQQSRLVSFDTLGDKDNAIALCPLCHRNYDNLLDPGLVFIPTDLDFFISFEQSDQERRKKEMIETQSPPPARVTPSPEVYRQYQLQQGLVEEEDNGGLYNCYILKEYLPRFVAQSTVGLSLFFKNPHVWHGSPTAAIHRATIVIATLHQKVPQEIIRKLFTLSMLYAEEIEWHPISEQGRNRADPGNDGEGFPDHGESGAGGPQQSGDSHRAEPNSTSNSSRPAIPGGISDGQGMHRFGVGETGRSRDCVGSPGRKRSQRYSSTARDCKSMKKPTTVRSTSKNEGHEPKRTKLDTNPTWGPYSTSAKAIAFFNEVYNHSKALKG